MHRELTKHLILDLDRKLVLLSGPRQVGKTTLSKALFKKYVYLNYDDSDDRRLLLKRSWSRETDLIVFDELHKKPKWKSWIKGIFDTEGVRPRLLVTGSARMDIHKKGGDSLAGRHFHLRLHPLTVAELNGQMKPQEALQRLLNHGGFPEPFLENKEAFSKRWRATHLDRIIKEDLLELEQVRNLKQIEVLTDLLADRVGSPISFNSLARDLEISPHTVKKWISILESLYVIFVVTPYSKNLARALLKEPKIYFYDTGRVKNDPGVRLENVVACALLRQLHLRQDILGEKTALHYVRDKEKREVDFLTVVDREIQDLVEVKVSDDQPSASLKYFSSKLKARHTVQVVQNLNRDSVKGQIAVLNAAHWLSHLGPVLSAFESSPS